MKINEKKNEKKNFAFKHINCNTTIALMQKFNRVP